MSDYTPSWAGEVPDVEETPEDEQYGDGVDHDAPETAGTGDEGGDVVPHGRTDHDSDDDAYTPTYASGPEVDDPVDEDELYGGGLDHDHEAPHATPDRSPDTVDDGLSVPIDFETPEWVDDTRAVRDEDLRDRAAVDAVCIECLDDAARASYQVVGVPHASAFYQLLDRHGFARSVGDGPRIWMADGGLDVVVHGASADPAVGDTYVSYLEVSGPADDVAAFVEDLLDVVVFAKRELRAPSLVEDADAAEEAGERVADSDRLVDRERAADAVLRLPGAGSE
jgi:hypothetical protein